MNNNRLFTLETTPIEIIAGDTIALPYQALKEDGSIVDLNQAKEIEWILSPYNDLSNAVLTKKLTEGKVVISDGSPNCFSVILETNETKDLSGMFVYQIAITDSANRVNRRVQGNLHIWQSN